MRKAKFWADGRPTGSDLDAGLPRLVMGSRLSSGQLWREDNPALRRVLEQREITAEILIYEYPSSSRRTAHGVWLYPAGGPVPLCRATHSGYFTLRQYLSFTRAHRGKRSSRICPENPSQRSRLGS